MKQNIRNYIDATFLKTIENGLSKQEVQQEIATLLQDAVVQKYKAVMIRPEFVHQAKQFLLQHQSKVLVGTVIDFPYGNGGLEAKLLEAANAIENGADDLDFVIDYQAYKNGEIEKVEKEVKECTSLGLQHGKTVKWIIETAALNDLEIARISSLVKKIVLRFFKEADIENVFVKSSTGFYPATDGKPNGATEHNIIIMLENASPLPVKASGGVRTFEDAKRMIQLGVKRIGTSSQKTIVTHAESISTS